MQPATQVTCMSSGIAAAADKVQLCRGRPAMPANSCWPDTRLLHAHTRGRAPRCLLHLPCHQSLCRSQLPISTGLARQSRTPRWCQLLTCCSRSLDTLFITERGVACLQNFSRKPSCKSVHASFERPGDDFVFGSAAETTLASVHSLKNLQKRAGMQTGELCCCNAIWSTGLVPATSATKLGRHMGF